jgi:ribosomal protein S27AE
MSGAESEAGSSPETCPDCGSFLPDPDGDETVTCGNCGTASNGETVTVYRFECDSGGCPTGNGQLRQREGFARVGHRIHDEMREECEPFVQAYEAIPKRGPRNFELLREIEDSDE